MSRLYLLDTNVISEPLKPNPDPNVVAKLADADGQLAIPSVVLHELVFGVERLPQSRRRTYIERFLRDVVARTLDILPYDTTAAAWHGRERARLHSRGQTPSFVDGQIAAIAATCGLVLVTRNILDFQHFRDLHIVNWFTTTASPP